MTTDKNTSSSSPDEVDDKVIESASGGAGKLGLKFAKRRQKNTKKAIANGANMSVIDELPIAAESGKSISVGTQAAKQTASIGTQTEKASSSTGKIVVGGIASVVAADIAAEAINNTD